MNRNTFILAVVFTLLSLTGLGAVPKAVATGWDIACVPAAQIVEQADRFAKAGFDGINFKFGFDGIELEGGGTAEDGCPCNGGVWSRTALERYIPIFRTAMSKACFKESFVGFHFAPKRRLAWRDDKAWADFATNMRTVAHVAHEGGLRGLFLDTEDYWKQFQFLHREQDGNFDEIARIVRRRGAEVFRGVFEEFPDVTVLTYWWLSFVREYAASYDIKADIRGYRDLLPAFTDGILDVMPDAATFVDGNEFTYHGGFDRNFIAQSHEFADLVAPEHKRKYRTCFRAGCAIYLDMFVNPQFKADGSRHPWYVGPVGGSRLNALIDRFEDAFCFSEEYVWVFGEKRSFADWQDVKIPPRWEDAFTNGTWETSLPGFAEQLRILKDPRGTLLPRLRELKSSGQAVNVASEPDRRDSYSVRAKVEGVQHGEWYAFVVEVKSAHPWVWIHPTVNGRRDWAQRQDHVILEAPGADGFRRGVGFARVRGNTTGFGVECSYNHNCRTKIEVRRAEAYRVYAP